MKIVSSQKQSRHLMDVGVVVVVLVVYNVRIYFLRLLYWWVMLSILYYMQPAPYACNICNMIFVNSEKLLQHEMIVHVDQMLQCQSCNEVFTNKEEFKKH